MNYHNITTDDMLNGDGLRVVLWISGCELNCFNCQNPQTHNPNSGIVFDKKAEDELFKELDKEYISGITFSGGHPLLEENLSEIERLIDKVKTEYPNKSIWLYTGYTYEEIQKHAIRKRIVDKVDVLCDGRFMELLKDNNLHWVGSSNQRVIDIKRTLQENKIVLLIGE